jgi:hypothetical protein
MGLMGDTYLAATMTWSSCKGTNDELIQGRLTLAMTSHNELLILELLCNITGARARHFDPGFGEDGAYRCHEQNIQNSVNWIDKCRMEGPWGRDVISEARGGSKLSRFFHRLPRRKKTLTPKMGAWSHLTYLPNSKDFNEEIIGETREEHLADDVDMRGKCWLEDDGHVQSVEELYGVWAMLSTEAVALDWNLDAEALEVDVERRWNKEMMAPSNSGLQPVLMVVGEKAFQTIDSQMLVAMKREIPEPRP